MENSTYKSEDGLQNQIYIWFNNTYCLKNQQHRCLIFAIPNGGSRNFLEAKKMKATGTLAGASDLIVMMPNKMLFVELKTMTGRQSDKQIDFQQRVEALGFQYEVVRTLSEFQRLVYRERRRSLLKTAVIERMKRGNLFWKLFRKMLK